MYSMPTAKKSIRKSRRAKQFPYTHIGSLNGAYANKAVV